MAKIEKVLIIGHGSTAIRHATNIVTSWPSTVQIAFLRRKKVSEFKFATYFFDLEQAKSWNPDAVLICTPSRSHALYLEHFCDKHIFVEKPAVFEFDEIPLLEKIDQNKKVLQIGFNLRYHKLFNLDKIKEDLLKRNNIIVQWDHHDYLPNWHPWEDYKETYPASDGVSMTLCHGLDLLFQIFGPLEKYSLPPLSGTDEKLKISSITNFSTSFYRKNPGSVLDRIFYRVSMDDPKSKSCHLRIQNIESYNKDFYTTKVIHSIDFNDPLIPRNESFKDEIVDFYHKILNNDTTNNYNEIEISKMILNTCR